MKNVIIALAILFSANAAASVDVQTFVEVAQSALKEVESDFAECLLTTGELEACEKARDINVAAIDKAAQLVLESINK